MTLNCEYCNKQIEKPKRRFCSHACAVSKRKGTLKRRGPNTGKSSLPNYRRDSQRRRRGWTEQQIKEGMASTDDKYAPARKLGYRSMFEYHIAQSAEQEGVTVQYEPFKLAYLLKGNYVPDFVLPNGIICEAKGYLDSRSRAKMIAVKKHNPDLDIRFIFMNANNKVRKGSDATYADWCKRYGFLYSEKTIPLKWFKEKKKDEDGDAG